MQVQAVSSALSTMSVFSSHHEEQIQNLGDPSKTMPSFIKPRIDLFDHLKAEHLKKLSEKKSASIKISLADARSFEGESLITTPLDIAKLAFGNKVADTFIVAKVLHNPILNLGKWATF